MIPSEREREVAPTADAGPITSADDAEVAAAEETCASTPAVEARLATSSLVDPAFRAADAGPTISAADVEVAAAEGICASSSEVEASLAISIVDPISCAAGAEIAEMAAALCETTAPATCAASAHASALLEAAAPSLVIHAEAQVACTSAAETAPAALGKAETASVTSASAVDVGMYAAAFEAAPPLTPSAVSIAPPVSFASI